MAISIKYSIYSKKVSSLFKKGLSAYFDSEEVEIKDDIIILSNGYVHS